MIDPNLVTDYARDDEDLLEFWLFCLFVRGKNADVQALKLEQFKSLALATTKKSTLFAALREATVYKHINDYTIGQMLENVRAGQYGTLAAAIERTMVLLDGNYKFLRSASVRDLEDIHGVGPKTARYFILHTRPKARVAALDTHILRYLGDRTDMAVPSSTPTGKRYAELEEAFLLMADFEGVDPAAMDLAIWQASRETNHADWRRYLEEPA